MSQSQDEKDGMHGNSEWEESLDTNAHAMLTHSDTMISDSEVIRRFLVTKDKTLMAMGATTKYLEVLYDGAVRIRDVKKSTYSDPIHQPWEIFKRDVFDLKSSKSSKSSKSMKKSIKSSKLNDNKHDKLKIYMDGKSKKRYFKFSTLQDKTDFFDLIEELRKKKDRSIQKKKYSTEPFIFAPYEVVGFFIRNAIVFRNGSTIKYRDKLIAITNFRIVVIDPDSRNHHKIIDDDNNNNNNDDNNNDDDNNNNNNNNEHNHIHRISKGGGSYNNPLDQASSYKQNTLKRGDPIIPALTVPHHSVYDYDVDGDTVKLETKDYRTITIDLSNIPNATLRTQSLFMMKRYLLPSDEKDIFAFAGYFSVTRTKTPSVSEPDMASKLCGFPELGNIGKVRVEINGNDDNSANNNNIKSQSYGGGGILSVIDHEDRMSLYTQLKDSRYHISHTGELQKTEYRRLGWIEGDKTCPFRVTYLNENYELCSTYPRLLLVPQNAKDNLIRNAAQHRSRNRLPVITWSNSYNISLARSSQPQAGASHKRNEYDERLLLLLNEMNTYSETFVICDCRPRVNAIANQYMKGKGFESGDNYEKAHIIFFDIQNIHEMRKSVNALKKCCEDQFDNNWLKNLHETQWFQHITKILQCSRRCANMIDKDKYSVLVHCSDGWDRTAQVCCLSELLLDPYYRTFNGFLILIQKEWLWFGHKFADRNMNYNGSKQIKQTDHNKHNKRERSPIFLQFLDCCFQVMMQFPWAFDFTQDLLLEFSLHSNSGRFGDFFCNSIKERQEQQLWLKTPSLFKYLSALWKLGRFRNPDYIPTKTVLRPRYAVRDMILWDEVYCRFTMHDKDRHSSSLFTSSSSSIAITPRNHQPSISQSVGVGVGKNRYHPRSPRISSKMFKGGSGDNKNSKIQSPLIQPMTAGSMINQYNSDNVDDDNKPYKYTRSKPPPPPKNKNINKKTELIASDTSAINTDQTIDIDDIGLKPVAPITVDTDDDDDDDDDDDNDDHHHHHSFRDSDSDSTSIPEKVKRITLLQKKVAALESILKEYRNKELNRNNNKNNIVDIGNHDDYEHDVNVHIDTPSSTKQSKGNIV